jgi:hypothetical protein
MSYRRNMLRSLILHLRLWNLKDDILFIDGEDVKHCLIQNIDIIAFLTNKIPFGPNRRSRHEQRDTGDSHFGKI